MALGGLFGFALLMLDFWSPGIFVHHSETLRGGLMVDAALILTFGLQHSFMARIGFKGRLKQWIPDILVESNYVLLSGFFLLLIAGLWVRNPNSWFDFRGTPVWWIFASISALGILIMAWAGWVMNATELLGLEVIKAIVNGKRQQPTEFHIPGPYQWVRHPLYLGILLVIWSVPVFSPDQLIFAGGFTVYILIGASYEERDLVRRFGEDYRKYQQTVPMLLPTPRFRKG